MTIAIETVGLSKYYGHHKAIDNINLQVPSGQITGLLGHNGSGKSTLLTILTTLLYPTHGTAIIAGHDIIRTPNKVKKNIGVVFQDLSLDKNMTISENLYLSGALYQVPKFKIKSYIDEMLLLVEMKEALHKPIYALSGGMRRIIDIIRALLHQPNILILDELSAGVDSVNRFKIWNLINLLVKNKNLTVFFTTHHLEEAKLSNKVIFIDKGKILGEGKPDILTNQLGQYIIEVAGPDMQALYNDLSPVFGKPLNHENRYLFCLIEETKASFDNIKNYTKAEVTQLSIRKPTLNDVYLWLQSQV